MFFYFQIVRTNSCKILFKKTCARKLDFFLFFFIIFRILSSYTDAKNFKKKRKKKLKIESISPKIRKKIEIRRNTVKTIYKGKKLQNYQSLWRTQHRAALHSLSMLFFFSSFSFLSFLIIH